MCSLNMIANRKEKSIAQSQPFQVEIHPYVDSSDAGLVWDDLEYKDRWGLVASKNVDVRRGVHGSTCFIIWSAVLNMLHDR